MPGSYFTYTSYLNLAHLGRHRRTGGPSPSISSVASNGGWLNLHYVYLIEALFLTVTLLSMLDLWTSVVALGKSGLVEGNFIVVVLANFFGLTIVGGLVLAKAFVIFGSLIAGLFGVRTEDLAVRRMAMVILAYLALLLLGVSLNNLYMIST